MQPSFGTLSTYPQPGDVLDGKYRVEHLLGEGGMGAVARAVHLLRRAPVALKFMSAAVLSLPGSVERFVNEGVAASQIDSDHVVKIFDVGRLPSGAPYLVMELLDGLDLGQLIERDGPTLPVPRAVHFILQALRALQTAHIAGIIHRDMKPSNCFVIEKDGEPDFVKLVDFGISKVRASEDGQPNLTRTNSALGTPLYMSPEQARSPRDVDHRTDLYSVGAILYEMLAGRTPYTADTGEYTEILFKIFTTEPDPIAQLRPDLPEGLAAVVHHALQRDREERFESASAMAEALAPFADERSQQILTRLRSGRRSHKPAEPRAATTITPAAESTRATQAEATAQTHVSDSSALGPARPASTAVGVTREQSPSGPPARGPSAGATVAIALVVVAALAGTGFAIFGGRSSGSAKTMAAPLPATPLPSAPSALGSVVLSPPPDNAAPTALVVLSPEAPATPSSPSAHPGVPTKALPHESAPPPGTPTSSTAHSPLPTQLGDLKLH